MTLRKRNKLNKMATPPIPEILWRISRRDYLVHNGYIVGNAFGPPLQEDINSSSVELFKFLPMMDERDLDKVVDFFLSVREFTKKGETKSSEWMLDDSYKLLKIRSASVQILRQHPHPALSHWEYGGRVLLKDLVSEEERKW